MVLVRRGFNPTFAASWLTSSPCKCCDLRCLAVRIQVRPCPDLVPEFSRSARRPRKRRRDQHAAGNAIGVNTRAAFAGSDDRTIVGAIVRAIVDGDFVCGWRDPGWVTSPRG